MNYRRGLQRVYVVLTVAWIAVVFFTIITDRWEPWSHLKPLPAGWSFAPAQTYEFAPSELRPIINPEEYLAHERARERWEWAVGLTLIVPTALYLPLFHIYRWIYRGFRTT